MDTLAKGKEMLKDMVAKGDEATMNYVAALDDLYQQQQKLKQLFAYDETLNIYIDKATGNVGYLERKIWVKKVLMFTLIISLGLICLIALLFKVM